MKTLEKTVKKALSTAIVHHLCCLLWCVFDENRRFPVGNLLVCRRYRHWFCCTYEHVIYYLSCAATS